MAVGDGTPEARLDLRRCKRGAGGGFARNFRGDPSTQVPGRQCEGLSRLPAGRGSRRPRRVLAARTLFEPTVVAAGDHRNRAVDRLRESGQSDAGAGQRPRAGNRRAPGYRRLARPGDPPHAGGKFTVGRHRRDRGDLHCARIERFSGYVPEHQRRPGAGRARTVVHNRVGDSHLRAVRPGAGAARGSSGSRERAQKRRARIDGQPVRVEASAGGDANRAVSGVAGGRAPIFAQPAKPDDAGCRVLDRTGF